MFRVPKNYSLEQHVATAERNYVIQKNDLLKLEVFTNKGERIIDPEFESVKEGTSSGATEKTNDYLITINGKVNFPLIGEIAIESLTIREAQDIIQKEFSKYYQEPYVVLKFINKRVTVLGAMGGLLIPLTNENIRLTEVLALARGIPQNGKARNIRILRGEKVFVSNLSTIDGYLTDNMLIEPGDIIYVEPVQRQVTEALREYSPFISIITSLTALFIILTK